MYALHACHIIAHIKYICYHLNYCLCQSSVYQSSNLYLSTSVCVESLPFFSSMLTQSKLYPRIAPSIFWLGPPLRPLVACLLLKLPVASSESIWQVCEGWLPLPPPPSCHHRHNHCWHHDPATDTSTSKTFHQTLVLGPAPNRKWKLEVGRMETQTEVGRCVFLPGTVVGAHQSVTDIGGAHLT